MNFALLGNDAESLPILRAILAHPAHRLICTVFAAECQAELAAIDPSVRASATWEDVLADETIDGVIVAGESEQVLHAALQIAMQARSILLLPRVGQGAAFVYELTLIRDDKPEITLVPVFPLRMHPLMERLRDLIRGEELGPILHLRLERSVRKTAPGNAPPLLSQDDIAAAFLADVDLLRDVGGEFDQITALQSGGAGGGVATANVTLAGEEAIETTWSCRPTLDNDEWQLTLSGQYQSATLNGGADPQTMTLEVMTPTRQMSLDTIEADWGPTVVERFASVAAGDPIPPTWRDVSRAFELLDASKRSIARRRTIDLHFETPSERSNFKTQMTAAGCGVLTATFFGVLLLLGLGAAAKEIGIPAGVMRIARLVVFAPLAIFLALQFLLFLAKPSSPR